MASVWRSRLAGGSWGDPAHAPRWFRLAVSPGAGAGAPLPAGSRSLPPGSLPVSGLPSFFSSDPSASPGGWMLQLTPIRSSLMDPGGPLQHSRGVQQHRSYPKPEANPSIPNPNNNNHNNNHNNKTEGSGRRRIAGSAGAGWLRPSRLRHHQLFLPSRERETAATRAYRWPQSPPEVKGHSD